MTPVHLWWRLTRRQADLRTTTTLALVAFAFATGCLLTVLGGLHAFLGRPGRETYGMLAAVASAILVIPILTLGAAAARLAVSRRNERLAALRLAGATTGQVSLITLLDALVQSAAGAVLGVALYLVALPGVALLRFQGRSFRWGELWIGWLSLAGVVAGVIVLAVGSALVGLVSVAITPLGVANRVTPRALSLIRLAVAVVVLAAWSAVMKQPSIAVMVGFLVVCVAVINLVGPWILGLVGQFKARRAKDVPRLLAARRLADDPRTAWRSVSGVALATYVAGMLSIIPAFSNDVGGELPHLGADLWTGGLVTLVIAALLAAVSSGVTQTARLLDQSRQYQALHLAGTEVGVLKTTRVREVWLPLVTAVGTAVVMSLVIVAPIGLAYLTRSWLGLATYALAVVGSVALVLASVRVTQPMVDDVAGALVRQE